MNVCGRVRFSRAGRTHARPIPPTTQQRTMGPSCELCPVGTRIRGSGAPAPGGGIDRAHYIAQRRGRGARARLRQAQGLRTLGSNEAGRRTLGPAGTGVPPGRRMGVGGGCVCVGVIRTQSPRLQLTVSGMMSTYWVAWIDLMMSKERRGGVEAKRVQKVEMSSGGGGIRRAFCAGQR